MCLGYIFPKIPTILCFLENFGYILSFMGIFFKNALLCGVRDSRQGVKQGKEERPAERRAVWQLWLWLNGQNWSILTIDNGHLEPWGVIVMVMVCGVSLSW